MEGWLAGLPEDSVSRMYRPDPVRRANPPEAWGRRTSARYPHTASELHSYPIDLWDRLRSRIRFIRCVGGGSSF